MRIVHTEASTGWGGQELRILGEAQGMISRGHAVHILCPGDARLFAEAEARGIPVTALPIGRKNPHGLVALRQWLRAHPTDIVNTHSSTDTWLAALAIKSMRHAPPLIRTRHISAPVPNNLATRWLYQSATQHIVTTGEALREQLITHNNYRADSLTSVPTGVDTEHFQPGDKQAARTALGLPATAPLIGIVATLRSWKGHRYLLDAFAGLNHHEARLLIVGDGPQRQALTDQVAALGLVDRVVFAGNQRDVAPWLHALDIFALPSYANEGVPQAIVQAMLCALPIVTTPIGSITEAVSNEHSALIVPPREAMPLRAALERLLNDSILGQQLGREARQTALARFSLDAMIDRMEAVFTDALAQHG